MNIIAVEVARGWVLQAPVVNLMHLKTLMAAFDFLSSECH